MDISFFNFLWLRKTREKIVGWEKIGLAAVFGGDRFVPVLRVFCYTNDLFVKGRA